MEKLTVEQIAWLFGHLADHLDEGGSMDDMLVRLSLKSEDLDSLVEVGAVDVVNILDWASQIENIVSAAVGDENSDIEIDFVSDDITDEIGSIPKKEDPGPN
jgi:pantothenate kinase-related protein Tda10